MKALATIASILLCCFLQAQVSFRTIVPQQAVVEGDAFRVQYVLTGGERTSSIRTPVFSGFRLTSGPNIYTGSSVTAEGRLSVQNFVYTLEALRPGKFIIPGAVVAHNNQPLESNEVMLQVISKEESLRKQGMMEAPGSEYFLKPGEDPYKKIKENLFVKVQVDKRSCLVGEPVQAIFKLYSRLESQSDIIKNPGFYGFTVYDMVGLADKQVITEKINGRVFDVHTIRKVQLYPLQPGRFIIDAMEIKNKVEFSRSAVNRKTEQQIAEGMMGNENEAPVTEGADVYESSMNTATVEVEVKPLPEKAKPDAFSGAVGRFSIRSTTPQNILAKNEQGYLEIRIIGKGNFTQLDAPTVQWPSGVEGFEPTVMDELDKSKAPLQGTRTFRFPFVCAAAGSYTLPAVSFSYFDIDSNRYKTIQTAPVKVEAGNEEKKELVTAEKKTSFEEQNEKAAITGAIVALVLVLLILLYWVFGKKEKKEPILPLAEKIVLPSPGELLHPLNEVNEEDDRSFYGTLQSAIWTFAAQRFGLSGSAMNKQGLGKAMDAVGVDTSLSQQLLSVLETCEAGMFTRAILEEDRQVLLLQTKEILEKIDQFLAPFSA